MPTAMKLKRFLSIPLFLLLLCGQIAAAPAKDEQEIPLYDVELLLFSQPEQPVDESWEAPAELPDWSRAISLQASDLRSDSLTMTTRPDDYQPLDTLSLAAEADSLRRKSGYEVLWHSAWRQPGLSRSKALPIYLKSAQQTLNGAPLLEGTVTISLSRYLHADFDLLLRGVLADSQSSSTGDLIQEPVIRMIDHRRMRSDELHYIDHPKIGALIRITRYIAPEPELPAEPADAPSPSVDSALPQDTASGQPAVTESSDSGKK